MAVLATDTVTIAVTVDVQKVDVYYKLLPSTSTAPSKPTTANPSDWTTTEPTYDSASTNTLYTCQKTTLTDGTFYWSAVSKSTSYEASKQAWNKADAAQSAANSVQPFVIGSQTAATRFWTGSCPELSSLSQGQHLTYFLPYASKKETAQSKGITADELVPTETVTTEYSYDWLKLTLSDGSNTGWVPIYYQGTTRLTTHYGAGMVIPLVYRENYSSSIPRGWWGESQYYVNNIDRTQHSNTCKAASANATGASYAVVASSVIGYVTSLGGYQTLKAGAAIDLSYPILWGTGNVAASGTFTNAYEIYPSCTLRNNVASWSGTTYAMAYLVGTVSGNTFTLDSTTPITSTEPTSEDGSVYLPIGQLYSAYQVAFRSCKDLYAYRDGEFGPVSIREAVAASKKATDYITDIPLGGGIFIHPEDDEDNGVSITDAVDVYYDGRITASYGANGTHLYENGVEVANFTSGGAVVGQLDQMHLELANNRLAFVDENGNDAAYIAMDPDTNESVMYITRSVVVDSMQFGNWRWFSRANGNMSLKWIGPSA